MKRFLISLLVLFAASSALANTHVDRPLFECSVQNGAKHLSVGYNPPFVYYSFGPETAPEIVIERHILDLDVTPWNGVGRNIYEEVNFRVGEYVYSVYHSFDRVEHLNYGGVNVTEGGIDIAQIECDPKAAVDSVFIFSDIKTDAGQCWDLENHVWRMSCPDS